MLKKKNAKKRFSLLKDNGVCIKCCYCKIKKDCTVKTYKENSERLGITTYCTLTPNKSKRNYKKRKEE